MTEDSDPTSRWMRLLQGGWKGYAQGMETATAALTEAFTSATSSAEGAKKAQEAVTSLISSVQDAVLSTWPQDFLKRLDELTFSQGKKPAASAPSSVFPDFSDSKNGSADPSRMESLLQGMFEEYRRDLASLPDTAFLVDFRPLAEAFSAVLQGKEDTRAGKMVHRFTRALAVKARFGAEHYADPDAVAVRPSPRREVHRVGDITLHRYDPSPTAPPHCGPPLLIVYSVINRSYILDLSPACSLVSHFLAQGLDVYMMEWGETRPGDRETTLDDYIEPGISSCVDHILATTGASQVSIFGHCIGGTLATLYTSLHPHKVDRLLLLTTPFARAEGGVVAALTDPLTLPIDSLIGQLGHMPKKLIRHTFIGLKPYYEVMKWKMFLENLHNDAVMDHFEVVDRWANDNVDIPGEVFRKFVHEVFHSRNLMEGRTEIHGQRADLSRITCPVWNLAGKEDWIAPPGGVKALHDTLTGENARFELLDGGHLSVILDPRMRERWSQMSGFLTEPAVTSQPLSGSPAPTEPPPRKKRASPRKPGPPRRSRSNKPPPAEGS